MGTVMPQPGNQTLAGGLSIEANIEWWQWQHDSPQTSANRHTGVVDIY